MRRKSTGSPPAPRSLISVARPAISPFNAATTAYIRAVGILGVDVGGTFTDAVLVEDGRVADRQGADRRAPGGVRARGRARRSEPAALERFTHGTTVATNALLERKGARTAFVATAGFEHLLHLRRQDRAHLYRLCDDHPEPLVPLERCFGVDERIGAERRAAAARPLDSLPEIDAEAVAVCLLFSFRDPSHEQAVAAELRRRLPGARVVASHEIAPEFREYERASTTAIDAYLGPSLAGYLEALARRCAEAGLPEPLVMRSSGGVATIAEAAAHPGVRAALGAGGGRGRRGDRRAGGRDRERDLARHGRHVDRRRADRRAARSSARRSGRRRIPGPAAERRPPDGRRRRRVDRVARRGRRPARRAGERGRGARARPVTGGAGRARR